MLKEHQCLLSQLGKEILRVPDLPQHNREKSCDTRVPLDAEHAAFLINILFLGLLFHLGNSPNTHLHQYMESNFQPALSGA